MPLNSLTLSNINQPLPGSGATIGVSPQGAENDNNGNTQMSDSYENENNSLMLDAEKRKTSLTPWWKQFPKKTKNKNKEILNKLNKITEALPEWPWINAASKQGKCTVAS